VLVTDSTATPSGEVMIQSPDVQTQEMTFLLTAANEDSGVSYFCELNGFFIFVHRSGAVKAYKLQNEDTDKLELKLKWEMQVTGKISPAGLSASKTNNCIYLGDRSGQCIHCLEVSRDNKNERQISGFVKWTNDNEKPQSLSATPDGRLVVLVSIESSFSQTYHKGRLDIYNKVERRDSQQDTVESGILQMNVPLPKWVENPWCVTYSENNTFIITYGLFQYGIAKLDSRGQTIVKVTEGIVMPCSIKHVKNTNCVYVLDSGKHELLQFDLKLRKQGVLCKWHVSADADKEDREDNQPMRMAFSSDNVYAMVGMQSGRVHIYKISDVPVCCASCC
jgi:hypothetical protein